MNSLDKRAEKYVEYYLTCYSQPRSYEHVFGKGKAKHLNYSRYHSSDHVKRAFKRVLESVSGMDTREQAVSHLLKRLDDVYSDPKLFKEYIMDIAKLNQWTDKGNTTQVNVIQELTEERRQEIAQELRDLD